MFRKFQFIKICSSMVKTAAVVITVRGFLFRGILSPFLTTHWAEFETIGAK
jgi:hypothetical protein